MSDCIFCRIAAGTLPADIVLETEDVLAFHDLSPQAPVHVLVVPRKHVRAVGDLEAKDERLAGKLLLAAQAVARDQGVLESGFRVVANTGEEGGQSVDHLHLHVLGGRAMGWPPG